MQKQSNYSLSIFVTKIHFITQKPIFSYLSERTIKVRQMLEVGIHVLLQCCLNVVCPLQVWLEDDVELYDFAKVRPLIKKKQVKVTVTHS